MADTTFQITPAMKNAVRCNDKTQETPLIKNIMGAYANRVQDSMPAIWSEDAKEYIPYLKFAREQGCHVNPEIFARAARHIQK